MRTTKKKPAAVVRGASSPPRYGALNGPVMERLMRERGLHCLALEQLLARDYGVKVKPRRLIDGRRPSLDTLTALALALECDVADLWNQFAGRCVAQAARGGE